MCLTFGYKRQSQSINRHVTYKRKDTKTKEVKALYRESPTLPTSK